MRAIKAFVATLYLLTIFSFVCCLSTYERRYTKQNRQLGDTEITRVRSLREDEKNFEGPTERTKSVYLVNILPVPENRRGPEDVNDKQDGDNNELGQRSFSKDPRGRVPALFFLQKVKDEDNLPDGIYYRPNDDSETPKPIVQKDISRLHAFVLAHQG